MTKNDLFTFSGDELTWSEVQTKAGKKYYVKGYASTTDPDLVDDIVSEKALDSMVEQSKQRTIKLDFEHETFRGQTDEEKQLNLTKSPLGKAVNSYREGNGVMFEWELNPNWVARDNQGTVTKTFEQVWEEVKGGFLDQFSITFRPLRTAAKKMGDRMMRVLEELKLYNVALTGTAINPNAKMASIMAKSVEYIQSHSPSSHKAHNTADGGGNHMAEDNKPENFEVKDAQEVISELKSTVESLASEVKDLKESKTENEKKGANGEAAAEEQKAMSELKSKLEAEVKAREKAEADLKALTEQHDELKAQAEKQEEILNSPAVKGFVEQREVEAQRKGQQDNKSESKAKGPIDFIQ